MLAFSGFSASAATRSRTLTACALNLAALATLLCVVSYQVVRRGQRGNVAPWPR